MTGKWKGQQQDNGEHYRQLERVNGKKWENQGPGRNMDGKGENIG